jgi:hypothetical protein
VGTRFSARLDRPWGLPSLLYNGYRVFPGGKERPGRDTDLSPPSSAVVKKEYSYTSTPPMSRTACTDPQCMYNSAPLPLPFIQLCTKLANVSHKQPQTAGTTTNPQARAHCITITEAIPLCSTKPIYPSIHNYTSVQ